MILLDADAETFGSGWRTVPAGLTPVSLLDSGSPVLERLHLDERGAVIE